MVYLSMGVQSSPIEQNKAVDLGQETPLVAMGKCRVQCLRKVSSA